MSELFPREEPPITITGGGDSAPLNPVNPALEFQARLHAVTPRVFVTFGLLGINIGVFLVMLAGGVDVMNPTPDVLVRWGANFGASTVTGGEWWRLATCMFLHGGIIHLGFNMLVLYQIGPFVERLIGNTGFLISYVVAGLAGSMVSVAWNPYIVSVGASGAIFGLYGVLLGFLLMSGRHSIPPEILSSLSKSALVFIGYNAVFGVIRSGTDLAAHAGGLAAGFLCGLVQSVPLTVDQARTRQIRNAVVGVGASALLVGASFALPRPVDLRARLQTLASVEKKTMAAYNNVLQNARKNQLSDDQLADAVEKDVLPDWVREQQSFSSLTGLPAQQQKLISSLVEYMEARRESWSMLAEGLRHHDVAMIRRASAKQLEAMKLAKALGTAPHF